MSTSLQDANAGNAGDLVKHSVNLQTLSTLLRHHPWSNGLQLYECHAGRGVYEPRDGDEQNRENVRILLQSENLFLARNQWSVLVQLGGTHDGLKDGHSYAGSACLNATTLRDQKHDTHFYENDQGVSTELESLVRSLKSGAQIHRCNGEAAIARKCASLDSRCVIILDPFSISGKGLNYWCILRAATRKTSAPSLIFFYSWGKSHASDALRYRRGQPGRHPVDTLRNIIASEAIQILWYYKRHYVMWVVVPPEIREELRLELGFRVEEIRTTLFPDARADHDHSWVVMPLNSN